MENATRDSNFGILYRLNNKVIIMKWIIALIEKNKLGKIVRVLFVDEMQTKLSTNDKYVFTKNTGPGCRGI